LSTAYIRYFCSAVKFSAQYRSDFSHIGLNCAPFGYALPVLEILEVVGDLWETLRGSGKYLRGSGKYLKNAGKSRENVCGGKYLILLEEVCTFLALSAHTLASVWVAVDCDGLEE
jgi:hypothetical protein